MSALRRVPLCGAERAQCARSSIKPRAVPADEEPVTSVDSVADEDDAGPGGVGPSAARRRAALARADALRCDLERRQHPVGPARRARPRVLVWSLALGVLFASSRPTSARAGGPEARLLRGSATVGGHRLSGPGAVARATAGDVLAVAGDGRLELAAGAGRIALRGGGRLLVEGLGPPALRLLSGEADALGPLVLQTLAGTLRVPAGVEVVVRLAEPGPDGTGAVPLSFTADGPGAELVDARGVRPVPEPVP